MFKKNIFIFVIFFVAISYITGAEKEDKIRVAVLPFFSKAKTISEEQLTTANVKFVNQITDIGKYTVVERENLHKALDELKLQYGDMFDDKTASAVGKQAGAQMVIFGGINEPAKDSYYLWARMIKVETGAIEIAKGIDANGDYDLINRAIEELAGLMSGKTVVVKKVDIEKIKQRNNQFTNKIDFKNSEKNFIEKYYNGSWGFSLDDGNRNFSKYQQSVACGIALTVTGPIVFLGGMIPMIVVLNYNKLIETKYDGEYIVKRYKYPYYYLGPILGGTLMPIGAILSIFSSIPFWFAYMINTIYKKTTDEKLAFFDRVNFNIGFVMGDSIYNKNENRLNLSMSISL